MLENTVTYRVLNFQRWDTSELQWCCLYWRLLRGCYGGKRSLIFLGVKPLINQ